MDTCLGREVIATTISLRGNLGQPIQDPWYDVPPTEGSLKSKIRISPPASIPFTTENMAASGKTLSLLSFAHIILTFNPALAKCPKVSKPHSRDQYRFEFVWKAFIKISRQRHACSR